MVTFSNHRSACLITKLPTLSHFILESANAALIFIKIERNLATVTHKGIDRHIAGRILFTLGGSRGSACQVPIRSKTVF